MKHNRQIERMPHPDGNLAETVQHHGVSVTFMQPNDLKKRLERPVEVLPLLQCDTDNLPDPCIEATVLFRHERDTHDESNVQLAGMIEFGAPDNQDERDTWQVDLRHFIAKEFAVHDIETSQLPQHNTTLYVRLDDIFATKFSFTENTHTYSIEMSLERISEILSSQYTHDSSMVPDFFDSHINLHEAAVTPPYEAARDFTHQWAVALSSVARMYGSPQAASGISTFVVNLPEPIAAKLNKKEAVMPLRETEPRKTFDDVGGAFEAKAFLETNALAFENPDIAKFYDITPTHFLLCGPGGTGKTTLANAFAGAINAEIREYSSTDIVEKWVGNSGQRTADIFKEAKEAKHPLVLFFDEFDSLAPKGDAGTSERQDVKNVFKRELTALAAYPNIVVAAASNKDVHEFDEALVRAGRLKPVYVPIPNDAERADVWQVILTRSLMKLEAETALMQLANNHKVTPLVYTSDLDVVALTRDTDGLTGADIEQILAQARAKRFRQAVATGDILPVNQTDITAAIAAYQKP